MPAFDVLTEREREVAALLAAGMPIYRIMHRLGIRMGTARSHRTNIRNKLGIRTGAALTLLAVREGLISMHDDDMHDEVP